MTFLLKLLSRLIALMSSTLKLGTGVTWSGEIALWLDPQIFPKLVSNKSKIILIAGTNGKTTTAKMVQTLLVNEYLVIHNDTGANLLNGLVGTILVQSPIFNNEKTAYVFEIDESNLPSVLKSVKADVLVLLNLFRDQLDRYGEVDAISEKWLQAFQNGDPKGTTLIINADDPTLAFLGENSKNSVKEAKYFGLGNEKQYLPQAEHATDSLFCPNCGTKLNFDGFYLSHLGEYRCPKCSFKHPKLTVEAREVTSPLEGTYNLYNSMAAVLVGRTLGLEIRKLEAKLKEFQPAFGRLEEILVKGKKVKILLSKNPAGFNASLRTVIQSKTPGPVLLALNDRIPDGRDVSWIWDVDMEMLANGSGYSRSIICSGDRVYDLALRIEYAGIANAQMQENLKKAIKGSLDKTKERETLWILPTYSAMLEVRKILTGKSIL